ncbi:MAG: ISKra4 family transposase [Candidatus Entotheonellia bacterium]
MASNAALTVHQLQHDFHNLIAYVTGPEAQSHTAYEVELTLFRRLLALGAALLRLFFVTRAAVRPLAPVTASDGACLAYHDQRPTTYYSVVGKVRFWRHYFTAPGQTGICPLDAALSLPARCYSDLLREWAAYGTTDESYRESQTVLERILGLSLSVQALETCVADDAGDVTAFYNQPAAPTTPPTVGTILVVQADGKGVPMVPPQPATEAPPGRLSTGQKRTKKKEAVVTGLYTIAPYRRPPEEVVAALLRDPNHTGSEARPVPVGKELHATLDGKAVAMRRLVQRVAQREAPHLQHRVALSDGAEALQQQLLTHFPDHPLVLDIIHATEYLWDAANALLGETHVGRTAWVRTHLEQLLAGRTEALITALEAEAHAPTCTAAQRQTVLRTVGYYQRNLPSMRYDQYLAHGWPIGTGVVEGACGHLVKDRMEQAGMRWTKAGAQAVLDLRAVRINSHWEAYWQFHRHQQHHSLYGAAAPASETAEAQVLELAA